MSFTVLNRGSPPCTSLRVLLLSRPGGLPLFPSRDAGASQKRSGGMRVPSCSHAELLSNMLLNLDTNELARIVDVPCTNNSTAHLPTNPNVSHHVSSGSFGGPLECCRGDVCIRTLAGVPHRVVYHSEYKQDNMPGRAVMIAIGPTRGWPGSD